MKIRWAASAVQDRSEILDFIAQENPLAAIRMDELFSTAASRLAAHPLLGCNGLIPGTREVIPHPNYRMVYEVREETIWILTLVHTARMWPPQTR